MTDVAVRRFVITGGPCSGKTTILSTLRERLTELGFDVYVANEGATFLIGQGMLLKLALREGQWEKVREYQRAIMAFQKENEDRLVDFIAIEGRPSVVLTDRGIPDSLAYLEPGEAGRSTYEKLLEEATGLEPAKALARYDAVIKLTTAANGARDYYTTANNAARDESPEEACVLDQRIQEAYLGHAHIHVVGNEGDFEAKKSKALRAICHHLGIPVPLEIERKYLLISIPCMEDFPVPYEEIQIEQAYLLSTNHEEVRIRCRTHRGSSVYYLTRKKAFAPGQRIEKEEIISKEVFESHLAISRDMRQKIIKKRRICFLWEGQYFELDIFENRSKPQYILEVELTDIKDGVALPKFLEVDREVTNHPDFSNSAIASRMARDS